MLKWLAIHTQRAGWTPVELARASAGEGGALREVEFVTEVDGQPMDGYMDWLRFAFLATTVGMPPTRLAITGVERAMASRITLGVPSLYEGRQKISAES